MQLGAKERPHVPASRNELRSAGILAQGNKLQDSIKVSRGRQHSAYLRRIFSGRHYRSAKESFARKSFGIRKYLPDGLIASTCISRARHTFSEKEPRRFIDIRTGVPCALMRAPILLSFLSRGLEQRFLIYGLRNAANSSRTEPRYNKRESRR